MTIEKFSKLAVEFNLIPVYEIITADLLTPVLAYLKIRENGKQSFLLESVEGSLNLARYSFIGKNPEKIFFNNHLTLSEKSSSGEKSFNKNIFAYIKAELKKYHHPKIDELPDFTGGIVGFLGYETISLIEKVVPHHENGFENSDSIFGIYKTILAFDHYKHQIILISNVDVTAYPSIEEAFQSGKDELAKLRAELKKPLEFSSDFSFAKEYSANFSNEEFFKMVEAGKQNIVEGDIFQIVLSKRFSTTYTGDLFNVYRALRIINPSPYMYHLEFENDFTVIGTSPEDLLKVKNRKAQLLPIAGTRGRGKTADEDKRLEENLLNDPKELAEHTMLVDLGRNDLGRVCKYDSVKVSELMKIQRYSHVMHIVSKVEGELAEGKEAIDALQACFPAGTVAGAPKIRAMQLIYKYEQLRRNVYAGAVGYFDFSGNLDMCIAIRTLFAKGKTLYWQAGAGVVADSTPELETKEIKNKAAVLLNALQYAEVIDENISN
ncbi:MAG: anthranilate synthase component I [Ignavibacteriaceae bacterium]|jgi:anthranilate synthase component 1